MDNALHLDPFKHENAIMLVNTGSQNTMEKIVKSGSDNE